MTKRQDPVTNTVTTIEVSDIDLTLKTVEKQGGKTIQKKQAVADMDFTGYFKDTEGNIVGLWQTARRQTPPLVGTTPLFFIPLPKQGPSSWTLSPTAY